MKLRCPYCKTVFTEFREGCCPACGKGVRKPESKRSPKPKSMLAKGPRRLPPRPPLVMLPFYIFGGQPRRMLMIVAVIGVVVAGLLVSEVQVPAGAPGVSPRTQRTREELKILRTALEWFSSDCARYPTTEEGLKALVRNPGIPAWKGYYIEALIPDVWKHPYQYAFTNGTVVLFSLGPDGAGGTADDLAAPAPDLKALMERIFPPE